MSFTVSEIIGLQTSKYFNVAGMTVLIYDYMITLEDEARWVWGRKWDATRIIFTASRYLPFSGMVMTAYIALRSTPEPCLSGLAEDITHTLGIIAAEVLLSLRTYAFWQGDKRVFYGLLVYGGASLCAALAVDVAPTRLLPENKSLATSDMTSGCLFIASRNVIFPYFFLLVFEIVILFLTAYKHLRSYCQVRAPIVRTTYRDSMFYMLCIILITFANIIVHGVFPFQFSDLLDLFQVTLHSVLASRIMFNLRRGAHHLQTGGTEFTTLSDIAYITPADPRSTRPGSSGPLSQDGVPDDSNIELTRFEAHPDSSVSRV